MGRQNPELSSPSLWVMLEPPSTAQPAEQQLRRAGGRQHRKALLGAEQGPHNTKKKVLRIEKAVFKRTKAVEGDGRSCVSVIWSASP